MMLALAFYREKFPARRVPQLQTFLVVTRKWYFPTETPKSIPTLRVLDLEPQILETVEENPSTSTAQF
jgi:hypothetical protein